MLRHIQADATAETNKRGNFMDGKRHLLIIVLCLATLLVSSCANETTSNDRPPERKENADAILAKMTDKLNGAPAISFSTDETADRPKRGGGSQKLNIERNVSFRRPDRMYFKASGDRDLEMFYDGGSVVLMSHKDKVWGKLSAPPTIGEVVVKIREHYGMPLPVADLLGFDPQGKLRNPSNTGVVEKTETIAGVECNVLAFRNADVDWEVWIPVSNEPLPMKFHAKYKTEKGQPESTFLFSDWNLKRELADDAFIAKVPEGYEAIPVIQRASAVIPKLEEQDQIKGEPKR
jgi:hypothetical protein